MKIMSLTDIMINIGMEHKNWNDSDGDVFVTFPPMHLDPTRIV